jgi:hypothetical protein
MTSRVETYSSCQKTSSTTNSTIVEDTRLANASALKQTPKPSMCVLVPTCPVSRLAGHLRANTASRKVYQRLKDVQ